MDLGFDHQALEVYFEALQQLNAGQFDKKTKPTTWPLASIIPFFADPHTFPFVKPTKVTDTLKYLGLDELKARYRSKPNLDTYIAVKQAYDLLQDVLKGLSDQEPLADDYIDVQSAIFMIAGGYDKIRLRTERSINTWIFTLANLTDDWPDLNDHIRSVSLKNDEFDGHQLQLKPSSDTSSPNESDLAYVYDIQYRSIFGFGKIRHSAPSKCSLMI